MEDSALFSGHAIGARVYVAHTSLYVGSRRVPRLVLSSPPRVCGLVSNVCNEEYVAAAVVVAVVVL